MSILATNLIVDEEGPHTVAVIDLQEILRIEAPRECSWGFMEKELLRRLEVDPNICRQIPVSVRTAQNRKWQFTDLSEQA